MTKLLVLCVCLLSCQMAQATYHIGPYDVALDMNFHNSPSIKNIQLTVTSKNNEVCILEAGMPPVNKRLVQSGTNSILPTNYIELENTRTTMTDQGVVNSNWENYINKPMQFPLSENTTLIRKPLQFYFPALESINAKIKKTITQIVTLKDTLSSEKASKGKKRNVAARTRHLNNLIAEKESDLGSLLRIARPYNVWISVQINGEPADKISFPPLCELTGTLHINFTNDRLENIGTQRSINHEISIPIKTLRFRSSPRRISNNNNN